MHNLLSKQEAREMLDYGIVDILQIIKEVNLKRTSNNITYSKNIFLPLTHICQNNCGYCTFKETPEQTDNLLMNPQDVYVIAKKARDYNCTESLFTFGESADKNDLVLKKLDEYGYDSMVEYVYHLSKVLLNEYEILPHTNMGIITRNQLSKLSRVNASMGLMLETTNKELLKTIVHQESPSKDPKKRLKLIENAGCEKIPFTTGLLVGIGESKDDRIDSLFKLRKIQDKYGHIQEIILQNFKPKENIPMADYPEPPITDLIKLTLLSSLMFPDVSIQIPPNLNDGLVPIFTLMGADDFGGISPLTKDYINPNDKWPRINDLERQLRNINYTLSERLPVYDKYINREYLSQEVYDKAIKIKKRNGIN
ncbi:MAG: 7,8-didemethyl-8-hydroxy-5-deazariboflavin synthase subunit CofG [Methanosphaera stadtmanae]|jgi:FO synthase subunit 1|nr:7,8-didemethyl-8-hydroxy-5-deazariboflavin synthase subunit CofG [Methanosphaera stadtmanae]